MFEFISSFPLNKSSDTRKENLSRVSKVLKCRLTRGGKEVHTKLK